MTIGEFIHNRRIELDLTLEDIGNYVGVGKSTVKKWEAGTIANIKRDKIFRLAKILKVSPLIFVSDENDNINIDPANLTDETSSDKRATPTEEDLKVALFDGDKEITDEMWDEVKRYAKYIQDRKNGNI